MLLQILDYIGMKNRYWADILLFIKEVMVPKYQALLVGNIEKMQNMSSNQQFSGMEDSCLQAIEQIVRTAMEYPNKVSVCIFINHYYMYYFNKTFTGWYM